MKEVGQEFAELEKSRVWSEKSKRYTHFQQISRQFRSAIEQAEQSYQKYLQDRQVDLEALAQRREAVLNQSQAFKVAVDKLGAIKAFTEKAPADQKQEIQEYLDAHQDDLCWLNALETFRDLQANLQKFVNREESDNQDDTRYEYISSAIKVYEQREKLQEITRLREKNEAFNRCVQAFVTQFKEPSIQPAPKDLNNVDKAYRDALFQSQLASQPELVLISPESLNDETERLGKLGIKAYPMDEYIWKGEDRHVIWSVGRDGKLLIAPKKYNETAISHALMNQYRPLVAAGEAIIFYHKYTGECYLIDINTKSSFYQTDSHSLEIGEVAFKYGNVPLLEDVLKSLKHCDTNLEQTHPVLPVSLEKLQASKQARDLWAKLEDSQSNQRLEDVSIENSGKSKRYTRQEKDRVQMIVDLAAELWPPTKDIRDQFDMAILSSRSSDVVYAGSSLLIPVEGDRLKLVLSTIRGIMDRPKYGWDCKVEDSEDYAQDAATAISLIEACRKLDQPMPSDMPPLGDLKLDFLAEEYNRAYTKAGESGQLQRDVAQQRIYDIYAEHLWAILKREKSNPRLQDTSLVEGAGYT